MTAGRVLLLVRPEILDGWATGAETPGGDTDWLWAGDAPLGEALPLLRMSGTFYFRSELGAPWGMTIPPVPGCIWLHVVTAGRALLDVGGDQHEPRPPTPTLVPHGTGHVLRSAPGAAAPEVTGLPHEF